LRKISRRISHARKQLKERLNSSADSALGLVAIDASKLVNPGTKWLRVKQYADIQESLVSDLNKLHAEYSNDYDRLIDLRLVGISWHILTPVLLENENMVTTALQHLVFLSGPSLQTYYPITRGQEILGLLKAAWNEDPLIGIAEPRAQGRRLAPPLSSLRPPVVNSYRPS
jgi:hypothetical protein